MRHLKSILGVICSTVLLTAATAEPAAAQNYERVTKLTFSAPVELPGMTLPAGTYHFRLVDSDSTRHVVNVFDANDEKHIHTVFAMPARRVDISDETVVTFRETAANEPLPIRFWYYPADHMGQEFAYPKDRALAIAQATGESVLAVDGDEITRVEPEAVVVETTPVVEPAPVVVAPVEPVEIEPVQPEMQPVATSGVLPDTASELPLVGLIGLLALGGGLVTRAYRNSAV